MAIFQWNTVMMRRAAYDPKILLKVVLLAYSRAGFFPENRTSLPDVVFIALAGGCLAHHLRLSP